MEICILDTQELTKAQLIKAKLASNGTFPELRTNDAGRSLHHLRLAEEVQLYQLRHN